MKPVIVSLGDSYVERRVANFFRVTKPRFLDADHPWYDQGFRTVLNPRILRK